MKRLRTPRKLKKKLKKLYSGFMGIYRVENENLYFFESAAEAVAFATNARKSKLYPLWDRLQREGLYDAELKEGKE